jgi:uncharacterized protein YfaS (alpha-2-macroglobulin family)
MDRPENLGPYRASARPAAPPPFKTSRLVAAIGLSVACVAGMLSLLGRSRAEPLSMAAVPSLTDYIATFPPPEDELPIATPLAPLLAADAPESLAVLSPSDEGAIRLRRGDVLTVRFNRPMVRATEVGRALGASPIVLTPPIAGTARWVSRSSVAFTPDPRAYDRPHESDVTFDPALASVDGEVLYDETPRVIVLDGTPRLLTHESTAPVGAPLLLTFDAPVRADELSREIFAFEQGGGYRTLPVRVVSRGLTPTSQEGAERYLVALEPTRDLEPGARIGISVAPRWMSWGGSYAGSLAVQLEPRPRIEGIGCTISDWGTAGCAFRGEPGEIVDVESDLVMLATHALGEVDASSVRITPPVLGLDVRVDGEAEELRRHLVVSAEWEPDQVYEVRLARLFTERGAPLVATGPMAVRSAGHLPTVRAQTGSLVFERDAEIRWPFVGVHLDAGQLRRRVVRPGDEVRALLHPAGYVTEALGMGEGSALPLAPLAPGVRPNRWARGEVRIPHQGAMMEVVALQPSARQEPSDLHASLVTATDLGVSVTALGSGMLVWVTSIATGTPIAGAHVSLFSPAGSAIGELRTGDDGAVSIMTDGSDGGIDHTALDESTVLVVATGDDRTVMMLDPRSAISAGALGVSGGTASSDGEVRATVMTDRGAYRPEETVRALAIVRRVEGTSLTTPPRTSVAMRLMSPTSELPVASVDVPLSPAGLASATFELPDGAQLGEYRVETVLDAVVIGSATLLLSEYREPRFRLDLAAPPDRALVEGDALSIGVAARYLFGASVAGASAHYSVVRGGPVGHGTRWRELTFAPVDGHAARATLAEGDLSLDAHGEARIETRVALGVPTRTSFDVEVEVTDESGESTATHRAIVVRPADVEVGLRRGQGFVPLGQPLVMEAIALDANDEPVVGAAIEARIVRASNQGYYEWEDAEGELDAEGSFQLRRAQARDIVHRCALRSAADVTRCEWTPDRAGGYLLELEARDAHGHASIASRVVYVAGPDGAPDRDPVGSPIAVTPARDRYRVGEEAEIAFESPFASAEVMVIVSTDRVLSRQQLHVGPGGTTVRVPLTDRMAPNAFVTLALVRPRTGPPGERIDLDAPDLRVGGTELRIDPALSPLTVAIAPQASTTRPGSQVPIDVHVTGDGGGASGVEVALWAVDEGTLRLTSWQVPDPLEGLFVRRAARFAIEDLRRALVSRLPGALDPGPSGDGGYMDAPMQIQSRERYEPTPLFVTSLVTDASGHATATLDVPDRLTEYRLVAVAVDRGQRFGRVQSSLVVTQPVIVRPALPRFLGEGDEVELAAFVHDEASVAIDADVTITAFGEVHSLGAVHVEPGTDVRVVQRVTVPALAAPTPIEIAVSATVNGERAEHHVTRTLDVMPRARWVRRRVLVAGVTGVRDLPVSFPAGTSGRGALRAIAGTHPFIALDGVADDLADTWWSSGEIDAAVVLGLASHARLSGGLAVPGRDSAERAHIVATRLRALERLRQTDGGWMSERGYGESDGRTTVAALRARIAAEQAGMLEREGAVHTRTVLGADALGLMVQRGQIGTSYGYGASNRDLLALALHTLSEIDHRDEAVITREFDGREFLSPYALAHLALAMDEGDRRRDALVTLALTRFTGPPGASEHGPGFASADTHTLAALVVAAAETSAGRRALSDLTGILLERCSDGRASLADPFATADAIDALARVAERFTVEGTSTPVLALDGTRLEARASSDTVALFDVPFASLASGDHRLLARGSADRPVYLALDARWAEPLGPTDDDARGRAATLHRVFETPSGSPIPTGSHVALGSLVRVRLFLHTESTTPEWTAVRDPHAAGFEPVDGGLDTSPSAEIAALVGMSPDDDVYDVRAVRAMNTLGYVRSHAHTANASTFQLRAMGPGLYELTYALRASTPGTYTVGPASIEALREVDFVARSEAATFTVDP